MSSFKAEFRRMISALASSGVCAALALGAMMITSQAKAQQPAKPAPAQAQPQQAAPAAQMKQATKKDVFWAKLCEKQKSKKKVETVCYIHHEQFNNITARPLVSVFIITIGSRKEMNFGIQVPLGTLFKPGLVLEVDEEKLLQLPFSYCTILGCVAEVPATPKLIGSLKKGKQLVIKSINVGRKRIGFRVPLSGFTTTFDGPPIDNKLYAKGKKQLLEGIRARSVALRRRAAEAAKKKKAAQGAGAAPAPKKAP